ncbi:hypothetical protein TSAR_007820 [Trichomalopsis sarcophagae]|uniref:Peptidase M13 N-terminal domain-containing protein n=1 Tax=Trichomalopsis sarcophagae TaxID=543379 RepID=A0A232FJG6_9HYME|nr:hypothetical protein TSAR_007820 [Trichomalopsis sarcophagae]
MLSINIAQLTVTDRYFLDDGTLLQSYESYMVDIAVLLGGNRNVYSTKRNERIFGLGKEIIKKSLVDLQKLKSTDSRMPYTMDPNDIVELNDPNYLSQLERLLETTSKKSLANFQLWQ